MRRFVTIAILVCVAGGVLSARPGVPAANASASVPQEQAQTQERKVINLRADLTGPVAPGDSATFFVGNFAAQHNGAVITCDSAVRYSPDRIDFFGNVLINKNTTYIYGDRAEYDGLRNEARVFSDIVKVIDGDATLYTYEFLFNTKSNIGVFGGGGVMLNRDNLVEADHGYYYADNKELICVDQVQMRNDEYEMRSDSVIYNLDTDHAYYFTRTNIWSVDGDYLYADRGEYRKVDTLYVVTRNGYILTEKQEVWSDSIDYWRLREHAILRHGVQLDDTEHKTLAFGDYGEYWKTPGNALLTRRASVVNYDPDQPDSLFMRADSIFLFTIFIADSIAAAKELESRQLADTLTQEVPAVADSLGAGDLLADSLAATSEAKRQTANRPTTDKESEKPVMPRDSTAHTTPTEEPAVGESVGEESEATETSEAGEKEPEPTPKELRAKLREAALKEKAARKAAAEKIRDAKLDSIADIRQAKATARLEALEARERQLMERRRERAQEQLRKRQEKALRKGRELPDSSSLAAMDSMLMRRAADTLPAGATDSLTADSLSIDSLSRDSIDSLPKIDSMYRLIKAYRNVRIFRTDFQAVCDSLTSISRDSTIHLYIDPVLWNEENQITSDIMDIFTENQQIVRAEFVGEPMMVSEIDTMHYNQVAGKEMVAFFFNNKIYRNDVNGSARTLYYMKEDDVEFVQNMLVLDSGGITFYIGEDNKIYQITWRTDPVWVIHPIDKVPTEQKLYLDDFKWEAARRPTRDAVFDRTVRPTEREERLALPKPDFPIAEQLEQDKQMLIKSRRWSDRTDIVLPEIDEWMRSLGYPTGQPRE